MSAPESSRVGLATWRPLDRVSFVHPVTYTVRPAWTCNVESAWSRFAKFQMLNRLNWTQLGEALAIRSTVNASVGVDLRAADAFHLPDLADTLHIERHDLENAFCATNHQDALLDAASPFLRFCPTCVSTGFHAMLFQFVAFKHCPIHGCTLREACLRCKQLLTYRLDGEVVRHPYACTACGDSLLAIPSLRRLQGQSNDDAAGRDRLRAWHNYYFQHARLLSFGGRRIRDAAGQYLSGDAVRAHSDIARRLAFVGELPRYLRRPPELPHVDPVPDVASEIGTSLPMPVRQSTRCAWADDWPHVDLACMTLYAVYRNLRRNRIRRLARSMQVLRPEFESVRHELDHRLLLFDRKNPPLAIAMLGWRLSWERRFSLQTLARGSRHYPPFGLLEWLAFMPVQLPPVGVLDQDAWLLRYFVHALGESWKAWCIIATGMRQSSCYVVSPLLFPTRLLWLGLDLRARDERGDQALDGREHS